MKIWKNSSSKGRGRRRSAKRKNILWDPRILFIVMTWNTKRHPGEPRISPPRRIAPLGNDGSIFNRVASRFPRVASYTQRTQPVEGPPSAPRKELSHEHDTGEAPQANTGNQISWPSMRPRDKGELRSSHNSCSRSHDLGGSYSGLGPGWPKSKNEGPIQTTLQGARRPRSYSRARHCPRTQHPRPHTVQLESSSSTPS